MIEPVLQTYVEGVQECVRGCDEIYKTCVAECE